LYVNNELEITLDLREQLALERTYLANERTLLAYVRTGLSLLAAAAVMVQFFSTLHAYMTFSWLLAIIGVLVLVIGICRFITVNNKLKRQCE
jgi:putative membrane protein